VPPRPWPILALIVVVCGCGCGCGGAGVRGGKKYSRFSPDADQLIEPAQRSGDHFIVVRMAHEKGLARWPDTKRRLRAGEPVGFTRAEDGRLLAVAGSATRSLEPVPVGVAYIAWYHRPDRPLHSFAYRLRDGARPALHAMGEVAVVGGMFIAQAAVEDALDLDDDDEEEDDEPDYVKRQRKRERKSPSGGR
jgi:hypothetical protein